MNVPRRPCPVFPSLLAATLAAGALWLAACAGTAAPAGGTDASAGAVFTPIRIEPWSYDDRPGHLATSAHYRLHTTITRDEFLTRAPGFLEDTLRLCRTHFTPGRPLPDARAPLETYIFADRDEWSRLTQQLLGADAPPYLRISRGGYTRGGRSVLFDIGPRDTLALAAHEAWHQYTQRTFRDPLPLWLDEGIACVAEAAAWTDASNGFDDLHNPERLGRLRADADSGRLIPLADLLASSPGEHLDADHDGALAWYAQAWALAMFLRHADTRHAESLATLLHDAADGRLRGRLMDEHGASEGYSALMARSGPVVFITYFGAIEDAEPDYRSFVESLIR